MKVELNEIVQVGTLGQSRTFMNQRNALCMVLDHPPQMDLPATAVFMACLEDGVCGVLDPKTLVMPVDVKAVPDVS